MKRVIMAKSIEEYSRRVESTLSWAKIAAEDLAKALSSESETEISELAKDLGYGSHLLEDSGSIVDVKINFLKRCIADLTYLANEAESCKASSISYPEVVNMLLDFCKKQGCACTKTTNDWSSDAYVLYPADVAEFSDLNKICKKISNEFGCEWDTPLGGSWTGHSSELQGISFHISIERDYQYDPSGKEKSIQLYF